MLRILLIILYTLQLYSNNSPESPFVVFNASNGVILHSVKLKESINTPIRGTEVYEEDRFELKDERYSVQIKDTNTGEIFTYTGKSIVSPKQIVSASKVTVFRKFLSFLALQAEESGFNTTPVYTSQCVIYKGNPDVLSYSATEVVSKQINLVIKDSLYCSNVLLNKTYNTDDTYSYTLTNNSHCDYGFVIYAVNNKGIVNKFSSVVLNVGGSYRADDIVYMPIYNSATLDLAYINLSTSDEDVTSYAIVFNPNDFYVRDAFGKYVTNLDWNVIESQLIYQGDLNCVILIENK